MHSYLIFILFSSFILHPIHLSVTNVEYNQKNKSLDISLRIFANDLETIINSQNNVQLNMGKKNELKNTNQFITNYVSNHLSFKINNKLINSKKLVLKKRELKDITIWLNYSIKFNEPIKQVNIKNILLTDLYKDQKNLLIFTYNQKQVPLEFNSKTFIKTIKF